MDLRNNLRNYGFEKAELYKLCIMGIYWTENTADASVQLSCFRRSSNMCHWQESRNAGAGRVWETPLRLQSYAGGSQNAVQ